VAPGIGIPVSFSTTVPFTASCPYDWWAIVTKNKKIKN
jgi:hypothetical protein